MLELIIQGGLLIMPMLVLFSVLAIAVVIDRLTAIWRHSKINSQALRAEVMELVEDGRIQEAIELCANTPGPVPAVLMSGLQSYTKVRQIEDTPDNIRTVTGKAMEDFTTRAMAAVEKRLWVLQLIGNSAPLLGMTGTVTGMIASFDALMKASGMDASLVAGGISEALITTATGLIVAMIAVIPFNMFSSYASDVEMEVEEASSQMLEIIMAHAVEHEQVAA